MPLLVDHADFEDDVSINDRMPDFPDLFPLPDYISDDEDPNPDLRAKGIGLMVHLMCKKCPKVGRCSWC
jgi:hypothetical protein